MIFCKKCRGHNISLSLFLVFYLIKNIIYLLANIEGTIFGKKQCKILIFKILKFKQIQKERK